MRTLINDMLPPSKVTAIETDIALIKRDITQITQVYKKVDDALETMTDLSRTIAVQEKSRENETRRLSSLESSFMKYSEDQIDFRKELSKKLDEMSCRSNTEREKNHKELIEIFDKMSAALNDKLEAQNKRIISLENWKWYGAGVVAVLVLIINKFPWSTLLGG